MTRRDPTNDDPWCSGKTDSGTPNGNFAFTPIAKEDSLTLPIGTNNSPASVEAIINLPGTNGAPNAYAYSTNGQMYLFNQSDLIISNSPNGLANAKGTNITIWFQDDQQANALTLVTQGFYVITNRRQRHRHSHQLCQFESMPRTSSTPAIRL